MSKQPYIYRYVDVEIAIATAREQEREHIVKLLKDKSEHYRQVAQSMSMDPYMSEWDVEAFRNAADFANDFAKELIEGQKDNETVVLLTQNDWEQLSKAIGETE